MASSSSEQNMVQDQELPKGSETFQTVISEVLSERIQSEVVQMQSDEEEEDKNSHSGDETRRRHQRRRNTVSNIKGLKENELSVLTPTDIFRRRNSIAFGTKCPIVESDDDA